MPLSQSDRLAFSLAQVQAIAQIANINNAKTQIQGQINKVQALDDANKNLFAGPNNFVNEYQPEFNYIDGNVRSIITEQDIQDAANRKLRNHFFPNDTTISVPSLSTTHNIWTNTSPFALTYAIGKNYTETYDSTIPNEESLISTIQGYITSAAAFFDIELTSGQHCVPVDVISSFASVVTLKNNIVSAVNSLVSVLTSEVAVIVTNDPDTGRQTQNNAAIAYINSTILPALNTWLAYPDFNPVPGSVTTCTAFYAYNSNLLAPTKLHSTQLTALQTALTNRSTFLTTRISQLNTNLGTIVQNISDGSITSSSGFYGTRYNYLSLRIHILTGSLTQLNGLLNTLTAQTSIANSIAQNKDIYFSIVPTSIMQAPGNGTSTISLADVSFLSTGNLVYLAADNQPEIIRAVKAINGKSVVLNDSVPPQYAPDKNGRLYKDLT